MKIAGIVAEYNPFHSGHGHQIARTRAELGRDCAVVAVMSGNWVQQGDCAIADKWTRARLALQGGADLVVELPTVWAAATAESFADGAVGILNACGVVDVLSFGGERVDLEGMRRVAACLDSAEYQQQVSCLVNEGMTFAACRQQAVEHLLGEELGQLLATPNNNLGVEYIRTLNRLDSAIHPMVVLREGAAHNSVGQNQTHISATQIRAQLLAGHWDEAEPYLTAEGRAVLEGGAAGLPSAKWIERALLARLRTMTEQDWEQLPDCGSAEGLTRRLERAGKSCATVEEFFEQAKTKRYTHARLKRLLLWAYLGLTAENRPDAPPYIRVLGFNQRGREVLRRMKGACSLPIITKPAHANELDETGRRLFELEARCTDLYDLCFACPPAPGREWVTDPVVLL